MPATRAKGKCKCERARQDGHAKMQRQYANAKCKGVCKEESGADFARPAKAKCIQNGNESAKCNGESAIVNAKYKGNMQVQMQNEMGMQMQRQYKCKCKGEGQFANANAKCKGKMQMRQIEMQNAKMRMWANTNGYAKW